NIMNTIVINDIFFTPQKRTIDRNGKVTKIRNKESELLSLLCDYYPESMSREDIEKRLWEGSYVTDNTLTQTISNLRHALDDKKHELVITIPKKGYRIGVKPEIFIEGEEQYQHYDKVEVIGSTVDKMTISFLKGKVSFYRGSLFILGVIFFFIFFNVALNFYQVKLVDVNSLPILINLDKVHDKKFLSVYQKYPYVLLKKRKDGGYVVCKRQGDELVCEKK
ncbi:winged helix-turn-helix domain-containing protein, partial [Yersinia similis]